MNLGAHWAQVKMQVSLDFSTLHVVVVSIIKLHGNSMSDEEVITTIEDNRGDTWHMKKDADEAK